MEAFENLIAMLLRRDGCWTSTAEKVELTKEEKREIKRQSSPRWEIDVVAYRGATNELLAVECKSFLDSTGVKFRKGSFDPPRTYKLFIDPILRRVVLDRLKRQLTSSGACAKNPRVQLGLAAGHIANVTDREAIAAHFARNSWQLFDEGWIIDHLDLAAKSGYENDVAHVVAKLINRCRKRALNSAGDA
jgi:hypothetical protein